MEMIGGTDIPVCSYNMRRFPFPLAAPARVARPRRTQSNTRWETTPPQFQIRFLMGFIVALAPLLALARVNGYLGAMTAFYTVALAIIAYKGWGAGKALLPVLNAFGVNLLLVGSWGIVRRGSALRRDAADDARPLSDIAIRLQHGS